MNELQNAHIWIVEDEADIAELVKVNLEMEGATARPFDSGESFFRALEELSPPRLLILDLMLPGMSGIEVCKRIRSSKGREDLPIVILSAKGTEDDIVRGIEAGADDYVTKPFSPRVLMAKLRAVLKRSTQKTSGSEDVIEKFGIRVHPGRHEVFVGDQKINLRNVEFKILHFLIRRPGWVYTRSQIVDAIHGENYAVTERAIDFQMVGLRKKLGEAGDYIETVRGIGYSFKES